MNFFSRMAPQSKSQNEKHKAILAQLLQREDNKYCADCKAKSPRWASWNLGKPTRFTLRRVVAHANLIFRSLYMYSLLWYSSKFGRPYF